ncbi:MAG TPA: L,D-transpeptidase family protein [Actinomycetota bacterium]|nr:L,D-transpeptidase family protein [Actinomycetota bacterium]
MYGVHTLTQTFEIGRSLIAVASTRSHHVRIYLDRKLLGDWPISTGKPGDDTPNGTYLTIAKSNPKEMKGPGYDIQVPWSVRFTYSGDFMHDAFWSVGQQGFENVSHGCVNLSPAHAKRYYKLAEPGDPVTIGGSPRGGGSGTTVGQCGSSRGSRSCGAARSTRRLRWVRTGAPSRTPRRCMRHEQGRRSERRTQGTPLGRDRPELPDLDEIRDPRRSRAPVGRRGLVFGHHPVSRGRPASAKLG